MKLVEVCTGWMVPAPISFRGLSVWKSRPFGVNTVIVTVGVAGACTEPAEVVPVSVLPWVSVNDTPTVIALPSSASVGV